MRLPSLHRPHRRPRRAVLATLVAIVAALTGFEGAVHAHIPAVDGWHDTTPHGATAREDGFSSCSICRLAHEISSPAVTPSAVSEPIRMVAPGTQDRSALALAVLAPEHSPRAPPCPASC